MSGAIDLHCIKYQFLLLPESIEVQNLQSFEFTRIQPAISRYLRENLQLDVWTPLVDNDAIRNHIASLQIPSFNGSPSILLYALGKLDDKKLPGHISDLMNKDWDIVYDIYL